MEGDAEGEVVMVGGWRGVQALPRPSFSLLQGLAEALIADGKAEEVGQSPQPQWVRS